MDGKNKRIKRMNVLCFIKVLKGMQKKYCTNLYLTQTNGDLHHLLNRDFSTTQHLLSQEKQLWFGSLMNIDSLLAQRNRQFLFRSGQVLNSLRLVFG